MIPCVMAKAEMAASTAPAPPRRCPIIDFVEETQSFLEAAWSPNTCSIARDSWMSPTPVEVPCALM